METIQQIQPGEGFGTAINNALSSKYAKSQEQRAVSQEQRAVSQEQRAVSQEARAFANDKISKTMSALNVAMKAKSQEQAKEWYKTIDPDTDIENMTFGFAEQDVTISTPEWEMTGPKDKIAEITEKVKENPDLLSNKAHRIQMGGYMAANGISYKAKEAPGYEPKTKEEALKFFEEKAAITAKETRENKKPVAGEIQYYGAQEDGQDMQVYERYDGEKWNRVGAVGKFKGAGTSEKVPPEVTKAQQLVLKFQDKVDPNALMAMSFMDDERYAKMEKAGILNQVGVPDDLKEEYKAALNILKDYYGRKDPGAPKGSGATHIFTIEGGLQPKGK